MADVSGRDRAQLFIVTALTLGVLFVALAVLLNTAIFAENLATRSTDPGVKESVDFRESVQSDGDELIIYANLHNRTNYTTIGDGFDGAVDGWSDTSIRQSIHAGRSASVSNVSVTFGGQIVQANDSRNLSSASGTDDWTLASDVDEIRTFNLTLKNESLVDDSPGTVLDDDAFKISASTLLNTWQLGAFNDTTEPWGGVSINVTDGVTTDTCGPYNHSVEIDLVAGTANGTCSFTPFPGSVSDPFDLEIDDGGNATGSYRGTLRQTESTLETGVYGDESIGQSPYATVLIWNATLNLTYTGPDLYYATEVTTEPEDDNG